MNMPCECGSRTVELSFTEKGMDLMCHACGAKIGEIDEGYDKEDRKMEKMEVVIRKDLGGPHDDGQTIRFETERQVIVDMNFIVDGKALTYSLNTYPDGTLKLFRYEDGQGKKMYDARWSEGM